MSIPKRKNNIKIYTQAELTDRRNEMLGEITTHDTFLPEPILHDDLDRAMKEYVLENFVISSDDKQVPIIPKILTIQRWGEISESWEFNDDDNNIKIPFISIIRKPDPQPGTNPSTIRTIPDRKTFHYHTIPTWDGTTKGYDIYKIPQPVAVDINYEIKIVTNEFRDLNKLNKIVLEKFSSRQSYCTVKGHYIPIILNTITDGSSINNLESRRFYIQTYSFTMLGLLMDENEFEVVPALNRSILTTDIIGEKSTSNTYLNGSLEISKRVIISDGVQTTLNVGTKINELISVSVNGILQTIDENFYHISNTSKITLVEPADAGSEIIIIFISGKDMITLNNSYENLFFSNKSFTYNGDNNLVVDFPISDVLYLSIDGLIDEENYAYTVNNDTVILNFEPNIGALINVSYVYTLEQLNISNTIKSKYGKIFKVNNQFFEYSGVSLSFVVTDHIRDIIFITINGIINEGNYTYNGNTVTLTSEPINGSVIGISYII